MNFTTAPLAPVAGTVMSAGTVIVGGVLSATLTLNDADAGLPALSFTEQDTAVEPSANVEPGEGVHVGVKEPSTESKAETVKVTTAPFGPVASTVMSPGTVRTGGVLS